MLDKNQLRVISIIAAIILLVVAFMAGIMSTMDNKAEVMQLEDNYKSFNSIVTDLTENDKKLADGKAEYDSAKEKYDADYAAYEKDLKSCEKAELKFSKDVAEYNQKLVEYSVGKNAMSTGEAAYNEGRQQLDAAWEAYNEGKAAYDAGMAQAGSAEQYEEAKAAYEKGLKEYNSSLKSYKDIVSSIDELEDKGMSHTAALAAVSLRSGMIVTDSTLSIMKSGLDDAKKQLDQAKAAFSQMEEAKEQLDSAKQQLEAGEAGLSSAKAQLNEGKAKIDEIGSGIDSGHKGLDKDLKALEKKRDNLEKEKAELDERKEELKVYEDIKEQVKRGRDKLIDAGYGEDEDETAVLLENAGVHNDKLRGEFAKALISFKITSYAHMLAIAAAIASLLMLRKDGYKRAFIFAVTAVALGALSLIASIFYGSVDSLAFAAAVFAAAGVGLTISLDAEEE